MKQEDPKAFWKLWRRLFVFSLIGSGMCASQVQSDVKTIVERSVAANDKDFDAEPQFNFKEKDHVGKTIKIFQVTMIDGSPYQRLIANGKLLSPAQEALELKKQVKATAGRHAQTSDQRNRRIADYTKQRQSDHMMMSQLSKGFDFKISSTRKVGERTVWILTATPKPGYQPPNMDCQVLLGMQGEMWIDQVTYEWVKVMARVIRPVSIEGFLAQAEPGTRFEIEKTPVAAGIWQISHFSMQSRAKVFHLFDRNSAEEDWYYDFQQMTR